MDLKTILVAGSTVGIILSIFILKYREQDFNPYNFLSVSRNSPRYSKLKKLLLIFSYERIDGFVKVLCTPAFVSGAILLLIVILMQQSNAKDEDTKNLYANVLWALPATGGVLLLFLTFYIKYLQSKIKH